MINMGIYVSINRNKFRSSSFFNVLKLLTTNFIKLLRKESKILERKLRITIYNPSLNKEFNEKTLFWSDFKKEFRLLFQEFKKKECCLQIVSTLELYDIKNQPIPINFEIFLNCDRNYTKEFGHFSFELGGESDDFPMGINKWDFNELMGINSSSYNTNLFDTIRRFFINFNQPKKPINRINIGEDSMPWNRMYKALYIYRETLDLFQDDLFKMFNKIREEVLDPTYLIEKQTRELLVNTWNKNTFLAKIKEASLTEQVNFLNKENHFLDEYFEAQAVTAEGSYILYNKEGFTPLYPLFEKLYNDLNIAMERSASWKNIWDNFMNNWRRMHPTYKDKTLV